MNFLCLADPREVAETRKTFTVIFFCTMDKEHCSVRFGMGCAVTPLLQTLVDLVSILQKGMTYLNVSCQETFPILDLRMFVIASTLFSICLAAACHAMRGD